MDVLGTQDDLRPEVLNQLTRHALAGKLRSEFGVTVTPDLSKATIIEQLIQRHGARIEEAAATTAKAVKNYQSLASGPDDVMVTMRFWHLDGTRQLEFCWDGGKGPQLTATGHAKRLPTYKFIHGQTYTVPHKLVEHLNSITVPDEPERIEDPETGTVTSVPRRRNRFMCQLVLTGEQIQMIGAADGKAQNHTPGRGGYDRGSDQNVPTGI